MLSPELLSRLPGWELVAEGLADLASGRKSIGGYAVSIAAPRLRRAGLLAVPSARSAVDPEIALYRLCREQGKGHSYYRSILRRLGRFEHALDREIFGPRAAAEDGQRAKMRRAGK